MTRWYSKTPLRPSVPRDPDTPPSRKVHPIVWRFDHNAQALWRVLEFLVAKQRRRDFVPKEGSGSLEDFRAAAERGDGHVLYPLFDVWECALWAKVPRRTVRRLLVRLERAGILVRYSGGH